MGRAQGVIPDQLRKPGEVTGNGCVEDRLHDGGRYQRAHAVASENDHGPLDTLHGVRCHTVKRTVGHLQQAADQGGIARDDGRELPPGHVLVVDRPHDLRQQVRPPRKVAFLGIDVGDGGECFRDHLFMRRSHLAPVADSELELAQSLHDLRVVQKLARGGLQHRGFRQAAQIRWRLRHGWPAAARPYGAHRKRSANQGKGVHPEGCNQQQRQRPEQKLSHGLSSSWGPTLLSAARGRNCSWIFVL